MKLNDYVSKNYYISHLTDYSGNDHLEKQNFFIPVVSNSVTKPQKKSDNSLDDLLHDDMEFISAMMSEKENLIKEAAFEIKHQINTRKELKHRIIESLDKAICKTINHLYRIPGSRNSPEAQSLVSETENQIIRLNTLKMTEELSFWKDTVLLQKELREVIKEEKSSINLNRLNL